MKKVFITLFLGILIVMAVPVLRHIVYVDNSVTEEFITEEYITEENYEYNMMYYLGFFELDINDTLINFTTDYDYFYISYLYQYNDGIDVYYLTGTAIINDDNQLLPVLYGNINDPILTIQVVLNQSIEIVLSPTYLFEYMFITVLGGNYA